MTKCNTATIFDIYRGTTHDGPGLRSTVFFKGCPLRCLWCHNPEGIEFGIEVWQEVGKCIGCGLCIKACENGAIKQDDKGLFTDKDLCVRCGICVKECPPGAMKFTGKNYDIDELLHTLLKDKPFYESFKGGVTVSGGEPLMQADFVMTLFRGLKGNGIHTALDTCGFVKFDAFEKVLPYTDLVLYDLKLDDSDLHHKLTGQHNELIKENILKLRDYARENKLSIWIRTPLIPDATATAENVRGIAHFIRDNLSDVIQRWELCAFNNVCKSKYIKMRNEWTYADQPLMTRDEVDKLSAVAEESGVSVVVSGIV